MKTILDTESTQNYLAKFDLITEETDSNWGKMNAAQMFKHLNNSFEDVTSKQKTKRMFIGRIIGKKILKKVMKSKYLGKNSPTAPSYKVKDAANFVIEKDKWMNYLTKLTNITEIELDGKVHPFFGEMRGKEWSNLINKHINHHVLQFSKK